MKPAAAAEEAVPAGGLKAAEHAVADRDVAAPRRRSASTVPTYSWPIVKPGLDLDAAVVDVQVRAAHAGGLDLHDRIARVEISGSGTSVDAHLAGRLEGDGAHRRAA